MNTTSKNGFVFSIKNLQNIEQRVLLTDQDFECIEKITFYEY